MTDNQNAFGIKITTAEAIAYEQAWLKTPDGSRIADLRASMNNEVAQLVAFKRGIEMILGCLPAHLMDIVAHRFGVMAHRSDDPQSYQDRIVAKIMLGHE